jgi:hypothetical protein
LVKVTLSYGLLPVFAAIDRFWDGTFCPTLNLQQEARKGHYAAQLGRDKNSNFSRIKADGGALGRKASAPPLVIQVA